MQNKETQNYIAPILSEIHEELYGKSTSTLVCRVGWNTYSYNASLTVFSSDIEEAIELLEMNNVAFKVNPNQYAKGLVNIIILYKAS
tara:strand:+ start:101 stop:361 length:261 start_codon:yes stop_codon:yes gene_type:complete